jgi:AraC-like DNA-binding protein
MSSAADETIFLTNLWATPPDWAEEVFYCAVRAGHLKAGKDHRIERETYPGHEWIWCLRGQGWVQVGGKRHRVGEGDLVWVNCHYPHRYGAVEGDPWEVYWVRAEGRDLDKLARLLQVGSGPVIGLAAERERMTAGFEEVFRQMGGIRPCDLAGAHAVMTEWIARCFAERLHDEQGLQAEMPEAVREAMQQMRLYYSKPIRVAELAAQVGMPESSFTRQFRKATGTSPIAWLRQERIKQAKRRLLESDDPIKEVARQVGYSDQYFFSKDFKKMTKLTPSQFREDER